MSARKSSLFILIGLVFVILGAVSFSAKKSSIKIGNGNFQLEEVSSQIDLQKGLSGRNFLGEKNGMLFVFNKTEEQCMWMKEMKFSLDMIWLDDNQSIIALEESVAPETYPDSFCHGPAKFVIELNQGDIKKYQIQKGQTVNF